MADLLDVLKKYRTDPERENKGVWEKLDIAPGITFEALIASTDSKEYRSRVLATLSRFRELTDATDEEAAKIQAENMAGAILLDWRDLSFGDQEIPFTKDLAVELLSELRRLREDIMLRARDMKRFQDDNLEAVAERLAKNSLSESATADSSLKKPSRSASTKASRLKAGTGG